jgi:tetratricopeptide (TPR) repeat protein
MSSLAQGVSAHRQGRFSEAESIYRAVLKRERLNFDANNLLGTLLCQQQRFAEGLPFLVRAAKLKPQSAAALSNLGHAHAAMGEVAAAEAAYRQALRAAPAQSGIVRALAKVLVRQNRTSDALHEAEAALRLSPNDIDLLHEVGELQAVAGLDALAGKTLRRLLELKPGHRAAMRRLGICLANDGQYLESIPLLNSFGDDLECLTALAMAYRQAQMPQKARQTAERAATLDAGNTDVLMVRATLLSDDGDAAKASSLFRQVLSAGRRQAEALHGLALAGAILPESEEGRLLLDLAGQASGDDGARRLVHFAAAQMLDRVGQHDEAFAELERAHSCGRIPFELSSYASFVDSQIAGIDIHLVRKLSQSGSPSEQPVFIVGMPRSGTSLVEQIIASHPEAEGAGELEEMRALARQHGFSYAEPAAFAQSLAMRPREHITAAAEKYLKSLHARGHSKPRVTDKMPHNFEILGFIAGLFPKARIIHCLRDAADTCLSIYTQNFGRAHGYADDQATLGGYYREYRRLMAHWEALLGGQLLTMSYEELVAHPRREIERLTSHIGLAFDERCLAFHAAERPVTTFSQHQVRQPLSAKSIGRWRRHEPQLKPLLDALGEYAPR